MIDREGMTHEDAIEVLRRGRHGFEVWKQNVRGGRVRTGRPERLEVQARAAGAAAAERGEPEEACPRHPVRSLDDAWREGHRARVLERQAVAELDAPPAPVEDLAELWPEDRPLPTCYRPPTLPCASCRTVRRGDGSKAVLLLSRHGEVASFTCRACGHRWRLPVREQV